MGGNTQCGGMFIEDIIPTGYRAAPVQIESLPVFYIFAAGFISFCQLMQVPIKKMIPESWMLRGCVCPCLPQCNIDILLTRVRRETRPASNVVLM